MVIRRRRAAFPNMNKTKRYSDGHVQNDCPIHEQLINRE
jgi:hypothetical protein